MLQHKPLFPYHIKDQESFFSSLEPNDSLTFQQNTSHNRIMARLEGGILTVTGAASGMPHFHSSNACVSTGG